MKIPLNFGGGGGSGSNDCTATASDVLVGKTAIYNGSDDESAEGAMKDYSNTTSFGTVTNDSSNSRVTLTIPNTGKYDTTAKLYNSYTNIANSVSLSAAKIATGNTIMNITGTYTGLGSATAGQVLSGKTFSTASLSNATGTMTDKSGTSTSATSSVSGSNVRLKIPANAYYNTSAYLTNSYSNLASTIGLTAAKIKKDESILGITGTWDGYVSSSTDIVTKSYKYNSTVDGAISRSSGVIYITNRSSGSTTTRRSWLYFSNPIDMGPYSKITMTYTVNKASSATSTSDTIFEICTLGDPPGSWSTFEPSYSDMYGALLYLYTQASSSAFGSTGSGKTLTIDVSNIAQTVYIGIYSASYETGGNAIDVAITSVKLS